jgi:predicted nuclease of predicted toxin-antitoxin system
VSVDTARTKSMFSALEYHARAAHPGKVFVHDATTEGDDVCAQLAREHNAIILSGDSDFAIFDTP